MTEKESSNPQSSAGPHSAIDSGAPSSGSLSIQAAGQTRLGDANASTTVNVYGHVLESSDESAALVLSSLLDEPTQSAKKKTLAFIESGVPSGWSRRTCKFTANIPEHGIQSKEQILVGSSYEAGISEYS